MPLLRILRLSSIHWSIFVYTPVISRNNWLQASQKTFYSQLSQVFSYSGTLSVRPSSGTLLLRRLQLLGEQVLPQAVNGTPRLPLCDVSNGRSVGVEVFVLWNTCKDSPLEACGNWVWIMKRITEKVNSDGALVEVRPRKDNQWPNSCFCHYCG